MKLSAPRGNERYCAGCFMSSDAMKTAQALIKQRRYDEARQILRELDTPLSRSWLLSLEGLGGGENEKVNYRRRLIVGVALALLIVGLALAVILLEGQYQERQLARNAQRTMGIDNRADLQAECERRGYTQAECESWMLQQALGVTIAAPRVGPGGQALPTVPRLP